MASEDAFNLEKVGRHFAGCQLDDDVDMDEYLKGWEELNRMFPLLGRLFTFVQKDVQEKIDICRQYLAGPNATQYRTAKSMMEFELKQGTSRKTDPASGSRTLLRLHRALAYVSRMIGGIGTMEDKDGTTQAVSRQAYDDTLSVHHTWLVRKAVHCAIYAIPRRKHLINLLAGDVPMDTAEATMANTVQHCDTAFGAMESLYSERSMLDLP